MRLLKFFQSDAKKHAVLATGYIVPDPARYVQSGVAGITAIKVIRFVGGSSEITLIGDDPHGFYSRPGLAYYLTGDIHDQALFPRRKDDFQKLRFRYLKGLVKLIVRDRRHLEVDGQENMSYDRLLLTLSAHATALEVPGSKLEGVLKLDYLNDANWIIKLARRGKTAVVVGGGITALEMVEGLVARGLKAYCARIPRVDDGLEIKGALSEPALKQARRTLAWHTIHIPIGMALFISAFAHIGAALYYVTFSKLGGIP